MQYCFLNGKIIPREDAVISIDDIGLLRGYSVFDSLRIYHGKPFLLNEHLRRLKISATALSLKIPVTDKEIEKIIITLLEKNNREDAQIRILLTGGKAINGFGFDPEQPTFAIVVEPLSLPPADLYVSGGKLISTVYLRPEFAAKTTNYITAVSLAKERKMKHAVEILYLSNGNVLECSTSNFFIVKGNNLITPKDNILLGTTRNFILELVSPDFTIEERKISYEELTEADEAFISATSKEVLPIVQIDDIRIGNGKVGINTKKIMEKYTAYVNKL
jgi:branched-subunit amino acid aminotransferase/4-amino-4-deoxychorismate lyase